MSSLLMLRPTLDELPARSDRFRTAGIEDLDALAALLDAAFDEAWDAARVRRELFDDPTVVATFVLLDGDRALATASTRIMEEYPGSGYLHWVATDPARRGRGLGAAASVAVLHDAAARGLTSSVLETEDERLSAIRLYLALGYVPEYPNEQQRHRWSHIFRRLAAEARTTAASRGAGR